MISLVAVAVIAVALMGEARADTCNYQGAMKTYEDMYSLLYPGGQKGCCPTIVPEGSPQGSVITADSGYRGNVAVIVDWGTCPAQPAGGFLWYVSWGDGTYSYQKTATLGPFQATHQYANCQKTYSVYAYYCSTPPYPTQRCCDIIYGSISVTN